MRSMKVELYNNKWLWGKGITIPTSSTIIDKPSSTFDHAAFAKHPDTTYPRTQDLHTALDTTPDTIKSNPITRITPLRQHTPSPTDSFINDLRASSNKLFFIAYTPSGTITRTWYLVQVDLEATASLHPLPNSEEYYCRFLARHPADSKKCNDNSRW